MTTENIALELEKLRGTMEKGFAHVDTKFARVEGQLSQLVDRGNRTEADVAALEVRLAALEKRVWLASGGATLLGMGVPFLVQVLGQ